MKIDLIIFDLDGTLVDSKPDIVIAVNRALADLGHPTHPEDQVGRCIGYGIHDLFQKLLGKSVDEKSVRVLIDTYRKFYRQNMSEHSQVYPGVFEALEHFQSIHRAVLTNKNQVFADQLLRELDLHSRFSAVFGSDAFAKSKPDPLPILEICSRFKVSPSRTAMVGDSEVDLATAKGAGCLSVIVNYGYGNQEAIKKLKPDWSINRASELMSLFN